MDKMICVFSSSSDNLEKKYYDLAESLGVEMGKNSYDLIHGAGIVGLMGTLMRSVYESNCKVTGVVPEKLNKGSIVNDKLQKLVVTADMKDRKEYMRAHASAFIALPGGFGTLEEILEVITLKQLQYHNKPIVIINYNGFYDNLLALFETFYQQQFANKVYQKLYYVCDNPKDAIDYIKNYKAIEIHDKYLND